MLIKKATGQMFQDGKLLNGRAAKWFPRRGPTRWPGVERKYSGVIVFQSPDTSLIEILNKGRGSHDLRIDGKVAGNLIESKDRVTGETTWATSGQETQAAKEVAAMLNKR